MQCVDRRAAERVPFASTRSLKSALCIPVLNPGADATRLAEAIAGQLLRPHSILIVDSESDDGSLGVFRKLGASIMTVPRTTFDHGGTRNLVFKNVDADAYIFLTQDAIPANEHAFENLVASLAKDDRIGLAYGRQVGDAKAGVFARHHRLFNYPEQSALRFKSDVEKLGVRVAFCSNSFAAYRRTAIAEVGYFPRGIIFGEDTYVAAKMLMRGWGVCYSAEAVVLHSHDYSARQELGRYFDLGVFHASNSWYRTAMGGATGEGLRLIRSQVRYLSQLGARFAVPRVLARNSVRFLGYGLGRMHAVLPRTLSRWISANKIYWR